MSLNVHLTPSGGTVIHSLLVTPRSSGADAAYMPLYLRTPLPCSPGLGFLQGERKITSHLGRPKDSRLEDRWPSSGIGHRS